MSYYTAKYRNNRTKDVFFKNVYANDLQEAQKLAKTDLAQFVTLESVYIKGKPNANYRKRKE